ncbi:NAC domain-containing protein 72-like [Tripterygium wilfordii]|uniref:NAC domain-containing protein 72-like n=1 Tax=Tripterygium wilfordii TaxID=458696 RepID=A0A7J7DL54_TRIWF|nr:NAC domain-containing protein JA2L-like [Tripterygium wilfordii]KAF5747033.1 NAC domain-containing protein 72-like [Tripterygium wilfordii]
MGDSRNPRSTSISLPAGCGFYPSDEQVFCHYLSCKNNPRQEPDSGNPFGYDLIKELDLYNYEPCELPDASSFAYGYKNEKRHWFCFTVRVLESRGARRKAKGGYWRRGSSVKNVIGAGGKLVLGTKTKFVYYLNNSQKSAVKTDWVMYEYAQREDLKTSFVLCRVFIRSNAGISITDNVLNSCAEETAAAVHLVGIQQHDGYLTSATTVHDDISVGRKNDIPRYPQSLPTKLDDRQVVKEPASNTSFHLSPSIEPNEQVTAIGLTGGDMSTNTLTAEELVSILEENFIELDDLVD